MACKSCKKNKKNSSVSGLDAVNIEMAVTTALGGIGAGYIDQYLQNDKDGKPITDGENWRSDPFKRSGAILGLSIATIVGSTYVDEDKTSQMLQGIGHGLGTYAVYNMYKEKVAKDKDGNSSIAGNNGHDLPIQHIAGYYEPPVLNQLDYYNQQMTEPQHAAQKTEANSGVITAGL